MDGFTLLVKLFQLLVTIPEFAKRDFQLDGYNIFSDLLISQKSSIEVILKFGIWPGD